jgi:hypothetical protein
LILGAIDAMFASDDPQSPQRELDVRPAIKHAAWPRVEALGFVAVELGETRRSCHHMALLGADGLRAIDQPSRPDTLAAGRLAVEQPKPLTSSIAPGAYELRPEAAVHELPHPHADLVFDAIVAEPDKRSHSAARGWLVEQPAVRLPYSWLQQRLRRQRR